jgi:Family of unknown function (DUF5996)
MSMTNHATTATAKKNPWPALPLAEWKDSYDTLHRWTQIIGKIRLALTHSLIKSLVELFFVYHTAWAHNISHVL